MNKHLGTLLLAVGAGASIGLGGVIYLSMENKIIGSLFFTIGLYTIVLNGLNLFTGKVGYLVNQEKPLEYLLFLALVWIGNLVGTYLAAMGALATRVSGIAEKAKDICSVKLDDNLLSILVLAVFCGALMYIAVDGYKTSGNPIILFLCVSVFILCSYEHCVANMFYFSLAGAWSLKTIGYLLVMTLGNAIGAMIIPSLKKIK